MAREKLFIVKPPNTQKGGSDRKMPKGAWFKSNLCNACRKLLKATAWVGQIGFRLFMGAQSMMHGLGGKVARLK